MLCALLQEARRLLEEGQLRDKDPDWLPENVLERCDKWKSFTHPGAWQMLVNFALQVQPNEGFAESGGSDILWQHDSDGEAGWTTLPKRGQRRTGQRTKAATGAKRGSARHWVRRLDGHS